jgi:cyanophycin synthetase
VDLRRILALRGPNIWALEPVLEVWLDLGEPGVSPLVAPREFAERLHSRFPASDRPGETLAEALGWVTIHTG